MVMETGSLILTNYTAKVKDTGEVVETTTESEAKELGVHDPTKRYEPKLVCIGEGWVLKGVDEALLGAEVSQKLEVEITPEKGFGVRDPAKIRSIPIRKFGEKAGELRVGEEVEADNRVGIVRFIGSGRAQVDFNHRYAGKTILYNLEIIKKLETDEDKVVGLIMRRLPIDEAQLSFKMKNGTLKIDLPPDLYLTDGLQIIKRATATDIFKYVPSTLKVLFEEIYESPKAKEAEEKAQPTPGGESPKETPAEPVKEEVKEAEVEKAPIAKPKARAKRSTKKEDLSTPS